MKLIVICNEMLLGSLNIHYREYGDATEVSVNDTVLKLM